MEIENFRFIDFATSSPLYTLITCACAAAGVYSPRLLTSCLKNRIKERLIPPIIVACVLAAITASSWKLATRLGFSGLFARDLVMIYTVAFSGGILCLPKGHTKPPKLTIP